MSELALVHQDSIASPFREVELAPKDPILGMTEAFVADERKNKINLGVGVYTDADGRVPVLAAVREAESLRITKALARSYLPIDGLAPYNVLAQRMLFGDDAKVLADSRVVTVQALGGTGALRVGADFLHQVSPEVEVMISDPSWENHLALFTQAGFHVRHYPYYDASTRGIDFDAMIAALEAARPGTIVVLHACCHNPTGADPTAAQWARIVETVAAGGLMPFLDIAYQGFADGLEPDAAAVRAFADSGIEFLVASSFSKSFSLYGERVGALSVVTNDKAESTRVLSQLKRTIRTSYSSPPTHGGATVAAVLSDDRLRALWVDELDGMRLRIRAMRVGLVERLRQRMPTVSFDHIEKQRGMFSYSGLTPDQVARLRDEFAIYALNTGRMCVAALNEHNIDPVAEAIAVVTSA